LVGQKKAKTYAYIVKEILNSGNEVVELHSMNPNSLKTVGLLVELLLRIGYVEVSKIRTKQGTY